MKLQTIFNQLSVGEFSKLTLHQDVEEGEISEVVWPKLVPHINLALTDLHRRFLLREGTVRVLLMPPRRTYPLTYEHAVSNPRTNGEDRFILDTTDEKFQSDIMKIEKVIVDSGWEMTLNDTSKRFNFVTSSMNILKIPPEILAGGTSIREELRTKHLEIVYRANHPEIKIPLGYFDPARYEVDLPDGHLMALCFFVASRVFNPIGMQQDFHAGNSYFAKYENECRRLEDAGMEVSRDNDTSLFRLRGWA